VTREVWIDVCGLPRPQGSMRMHKLPNGATVARYPAAVYAWRSQVQQAVAEAEAEPFLGPVQLRLDFYLPRPKGHFGTGRNAHTLKPSAPPWPTVAPDTDKLARCVGDAITDAGLWKDDAQVCRIDVTKHYTPIRDGRLVRGPGVYIRVEEMEPL